MEIYQFIDYRKNNLSDFINAINDCNAVICLDLEDSVQNIFDPGLTPVLKASNRKFIKKKLPECNHIQNAEFGIRINNISSQENPLDLILLKYLAGRINLKSVFLTKVESKEHLMSLENKLNEYEIKCEEIVVVIETKKGFVNLGEIISQRTGRLKKIAFGHCDYNLDAGLFPFHHHDSGVYWEWIERIFSVTGKEGIVLLNSPYLELDNHKGFINMLSKLNFICGENSGQITLTHKQSKLCREFPIVRNMKHPLSLNEDINKINMKEYAQNIVMDFENCNKHNGFSIAGNNRKLISPHEYKAAADYLCRGKQMINLAIAGGCFTEQHNIEFKKLYHQIIRRKIENECRSELKLNIIRYERFTKCLEKIKKVNEQEPVDVLLFHIRSEQYLRLAKLYYRFPDSNGKIKHSLNLPLLKILNPEKFDLNRINGLRPAETQNQETSVPGKSRVRKILAGMNYITGLITGNTFFALNSYLDLIRQVIAYCAEKNIHLIIIGPASRPHTAAEDFLTERLNSFMENYINSYADPYIKIKSENQNIYINCLGKFSEENESLFLENGIHVNETGHRRIAKLIIPVLNKIILKNKMPDPVNEKFKNYSLEEIPKIKNNE